jgi:hypothetical protein
MVKLDINDYDKFEGPLNPYEPLFAVVTRIYYERYPSAIALVPYYIPLLEAATIVARLEGTLLGGMIIRAHAQLPSES